MSHVFLIDPNFPNKNADASVGIWFTKDGMARHFSVNAAPWAETFRLRHDMKSKGNPENTSLAAKLWNT
jgi:hypothetical protein